LIIDIGDTHCPLCKDADSIGHILGSCTHSEVKKVYISRHDKAMRLILKEIQNGSLRKFYCTADVGTAAVMEELGANSKRLPERLITPNTMQKCEFSPENKQKLRPDCMIVENAELCRLLAAEGCDVMLLPVVLGSAGTLFKCLDRATEEMDIPKAKRKKLYSKLHLHSIHSLQSLVSQRRYLERQKPTAEARGRIRGR
jgi:hypothetical protein